MEKAFKLGLLAGIYLVALGLLLQSGNGRYQYVTNGSTEIVVDTRTGEYWEGAGAVHVDARHHRVDALGAPSVTELKQH